MNKLVSKKTARFLAVVLAILVVVNVLPFGANKTLQARAEGEEEQTINIQPLDEYKVEIVDSENNLLPINGVNVVMELMNETNDRNDESNTFAVPEDKKTFSANTEKGVATFKKLVYPERQYKVTVKEGESTDSKIKNDFSFEIKVENVNNEEDNKLLIPIPIDENTLKPVDYIVKVKDSSNYTGTGSGIKLKYRLKDTDTDLDWEEASETDVSLDSPIDPSIKYFTIKGVYGKNYSVQAYGEQVDNTETGITTDPYDDPSTSIYIDGNGKTSSDVDLEVNLKTFNVTIKNFDTNVGTLYRINENEAEDSADRYTEITKEEIENYNETFNYGENVKYEVRANDGYRITEYSMFPGDKVSDIAETSVEFGSENINSSGEISVNFVRQTYKVEFTISDKGDVYLEENSESLENIGGMIEVKNDDDKTVDEASNFIVTAAANEDFHIEKFEYTYTDENNKKVTVDAIKSVRKQNEPKSHRADEIKNVHSDYKFNIEFSIDIFYLESENSKDGNGNELGSVEFYNDAESKIENNTVQIGSDVTAKITPNKGYHVKEVYIDRDGEQKGTDKYVLAGEELVESVNESNGTVSYSIAISNVRANVKVTVNYEQDSNVGLNDIIITKPYEKDSDYPNKKYDRYTYQYELGKNDEKIFNVSVSYPRADEIRGIEIEKLEIGDTDSKLKCDIKKSLSLSEEEQNSEEDKSTSAKIDITKTQLVTSIRVYFSKQWHNVTLKNEGILFVLDSDNPTDSGDGLIVKDSSGTKINNEWTNSESVTVSGKLNPPDLKSESKLDCVIWSKNEPIEDKNLRYLQLHRNEIKKDDKTEDYRRDAANISDNGDFSFVIDGEQKSLYYVYALDKSGNIFRYNPILIIIDYQPPEVTNFIVEDTADSDKVTFDEFGVTAANNITVNVSATDNNSGIASITLYCYDKSGRNNQPVEITKDNETESIDFTSSFKLESEKYVYLAAIAEDRAGNKINVPVKMNKDNSNSYNGDVIVGKKDYNVDIVVDESKIDYHNTDNNQDWYKDDDISITYNAKEELAGFSGMKMNIITYNSEGQKADNYEVKYLKPGEELKTVFNHEYDKNSSVYENNIEKQIKTEVSGTVNIGDICKANPNVNLNQGKNTIEITVYSRTRSGQQYIEKKNSYDFYLDETKPKINKIEFKPKKRNAAEVVLNILTFGLFANGNLDVEVGIDDGEAYASSGYKNVNLIYNGEVYKTITPQNENSVGSASTLQTVTFTIPREDVTTSKNYIDGTITAEVFDNVTNRSGEFTPKAADSKSNAADYVAPQNGKIESVMIENVKPIINEIEKKETYKDYNPNTFNNNIWYNEDVSFGITVEDSDSGVGKVEAEINGTKIGENGFLYNSDNGSVTQLKTSFSEKERVRTNASGVAMNKDGSYTVTVNAVDNAGNKAEQQQLTVYKDTAVPTIDKFKFLGEGNREGDGAPNDNVELTEYGYYFKQDTEVKVYAKDAHPSSGINNIYFKTISYQNDDGKPERVEKEYEPKKADADGTAVFTVPANFKGQIMARTDDNVGNHVDIFVTPSGTIMETPEQHEQEKHIFINPKTEAPYQTGSGNPLYSNDVDVEFIIVDTYSGINDAEITINNETFSVNINNAKTDVDMIDEWHIDNRDYNLITKISQTITVTDNINNIPIKVKMTDRAGNTSTEEYSFSIDKTPPSIQIDWDNTEPDKENKDFYNKARTATITVTERNFAKQNFNLNITNTDGTTPTISGWSFLDGEGDRTRYFTKVTFSADGDYTFMPSCVDDAGNKSNEPDGGKFTMDFTNPIVNISYNNNDSKNGNYYAKERIATVEITEHNFEPSRAKIQITADDNGKDVELPKPSDWTTAGNRHTTTINFSKNALYTISINVTDKAGNQGNSGATQKFYVDKSKPKIEISKIENGSANKGEVAPEIKVEDNNFDNDNVKITLTRANFDTDSDGNVNYNNGEVSPAMNKTEPTNTNRTYSYVNFERKENVDGFYWLNVDATDKAGNKSSEEYTFSVNRFGSVYYVDRELVDEYLITNGNVKYNRDSRNIIIHEVNVDPINYEGIKVSRSGTIKDLNKNEDYTVTPKNSAGKYENAYTIKSDVFNDSAKYIVTVSSIDKAKNENVSDDKDDEEDRQKRHCDVEFFVDKKAPEIFPLFDESPNSSEIINGVYTAKVQITDNLALNLDECSVKIGDGAEKKLTFVEGNDQIVICSFEIPNNTVGETITITAFDEAGNQNSEPQSITVTDNVLIRWFYNTPLFIGSILVALILIAGIIILIVATIRRKRSQ